MKSVALHNLGCKVNGYEMEVMQQMLQEKGYKIVPFDEQADIYIVNTCTVTNIADRKSRQMLHKARKMNPAAVVVAAGCYVQTGIEDVIKDAGVDLVIGNNKKKELVFLLEKFLSERDGKPTAGDKNSKTLDGAAVIDIGKTKEFETMRLKRTAEHTRAYIKIQDGCNQFCSYCIIPYARGRVRSREKEDILEEIKGLSGSGYKEVVLTGIHLSSYGADREGESLLSLVMQIHEVEGIERIRLGSLEPGIVTEEFVRELSRLPKLCPHFHLSLQSGCDATLKRMNRRYTSGEYFEKTELLRKLFAHPAITTDVIVGFPGETEEEFLATKRFLEKVNFYEMHIFKYSKRRGTPAASMEGQVPEEVKALRSHVLLDIDRSRSLAYRSSYIGKETEVLFEEECLMDGKTYQVGYTKEYIKTAIQSEVSYANRLIIGRITGFLNNDIMRME